MSFKHNAILWYTTHLNGPFVCAGSRGWGHRVRWPTSFSLACVMRAVHWSPV